MKTWKAVLILAPGLYFAAAMQQAAADRMGILGAHPNFLLLVLGIFAPHLSRRGGSLLGFFCGVAMGAIVGASLQQYVASRVIAGFLMSFLGGLDIQHSWVTVVIFTCATVFVGEGMLLILAPNPGIGVFLASTLGTAIYNSIIAAIGAVVYYRLVPNRPY